MLCDHADSYDTAIFFDHDRAFRVRDLGELCVTQWEDAVDFLQPLEKPTDAFIVHPTQGRR